MISIDNVGSVGKFKSPFQLTLECRLILKLNNYCSFLIFDFGWRSMTAKQTISHECIGEPDEASKEFELCLNNFRALLTRSKTAL